MIYVVAVAALLTISALFLAAVGITVSTGKGSEGAARHDAEIRRRFLAKADSITAASAIATVMAAIAALISLIAL